MSRQQMRGGTTYAQRFLLRMLRMSTRQRVIVMTFDTAADAARWDSMEPNAALRALLVLDEGDRE